MNQRRNLKREGDKGALLKVGSSFISCCCCWPGKGNQARNNSVQASQQNFVEIPIIWYGWFITMSFYWFADNFTFSILGWHSSLQSIQVALATIFCVKVNLKLNTCISSQNTHMPAQVGKVLLLTQQTQKVLYSACTMCTFLRWNNCFQIVFRLAENWGWWCVHWGLASRPSWRQTVFGCSQPRWDHYVTTRQSSGLKQLIKIL